jgi:hypothetical protein
LDRKKYGIIDNHKKIKRKRKRNTYSNVNPFLKKNRLGLDNSGKTTICKKLNGENIEEIPPTVYKFSINSKWI